MVHGILDSQILPRKSILDVGFRNVNPINHPPILLFNLTYVNKGENFKFYSEGITQSVSKFMSAMDRERVHIAEAYGFHIPSDIEQDNQHYNTNFKTYYEYAQNTKTHGDIGSPKSTMHRYITEDIPYGLAPLSSLAKLKNIKTPNIDSVINIFSTINECDYFSAGYNFSGTVVTSNAI